MQEIVNTTWCIANPSASEVALRNNIDYACNMLGDCKMIQPGGSCYDPNNLFNHASAIMNQYYAINGRNNWNCDFTGSGIIVTSEPSKTIFMCHN
uniref:Glucan endo-1,3-beta-glucosidase n=1 Tax=Cajanus cajan TaxID=3821 RepID=A0A151S4G7_CAJCA|nr:Glucan endo-1,3-beta-glucosidase [Cajanus cajan]